MKIINKLKHLVVKKILNQKLALENLEIKGFMNVEDSYFLYVSVLFSRPKSILEVGHFLGKSSAAISLAIRDGKIRTRFDSFDLPYSSTEEFEDYYSGVHQRVIKAPSDYSKVLKRKINFTQIARENLASLGLSDLVNFNAQDFRSSMNRDYDLIFADVLHDSFEIDLNLIDILKFGHDNTIFMFDDMNSENIALIETKSELKLIKLTGKLGAFFKT